MIISCTCKSAESDKKNIDFEELIDLSLFSAKQRDVLSSRDHVWVPVGHFERMLGLRRKIVQELISSGELISYVVPIDSRTQHGFGRRAYVAVKTYPCRVCCPGHNEINWDLAGASDDNKF